jgi:hypothetical protein
VLVCLTIRLSFVSVFSLRICHSFNLSALQYELMCSRHAAVGR